MTDQLPAILALEDGTVFEGESIGIAGSAIGEIVFNTAMTGYQEILTDPSYAKQIVTLTYPHIGNTGANNEDYEASRGWAEALVVRDVPALFSNRRAQYSLRDFLLKENIVGIANIDTRQLTQLIRSHGALGACVLAGESVNPEKAIASAQKFPGLVNMDLAKVVSRDNPNRWHEGGWDPVEGYTGGTLPLTRVVAYDFGVKRNILRLLVDRCCEVIVVPAQTSADEALAYEPDGIFLSNGPGDPQPCNYAITTIQHFFEIGIPVFGICLGCQLIALAGGAKTTKMKYGHHGANHPVKDLRNNRVLITSQNHGFCVDKTSLPEHFELTHVSLFDESLQGLHHKTLPVFGFQGHPEASPGPHDCRNLFDHFLELMQQSKPRNA